jgi:hypothetical protein
MKYRAVALAFAMLLARTALPTQQAVSQKPVADRSDQPPAPVPRPFFICRGGTDGRRLRTVSRRGGRQSETWQVAHLNEMMQRPRLAKSHFLLSSFAEPQQGAAYTPRTTEAAFGTQVPRWGSDQGCQLSEAMGQTAPTSLLWTQSLAVRTRMYRLTQ